MANGLLDNGWIEYWQPNVALGSLKGLINGIDFETTDVHVSTVSGTPSGLGVGVTGIIDVNIETPVSPLLFDWGSSDFLCMRWGQYPLGGNNFNNLDLYVGLNGFGPTNLNGFETYFSDDGAGQVFWDMPFSDGAYGTFVQTPSGAFPYDGSPHCVLFWWTLADKTMHLQLDGGTEYTGVSLIGVGPPDPTNYCRQHIQQANVAGTFASDTAVCRGVIPDATQRALLFGGLPFDQWDHAGGGGGITYSTSTGRRAGMGNNPPMSMVGAYRRGGYARR